MTLKQQSDIINENFEYLDTNKADKSDIPDISNLVTKEELTTKQDTIPDLEQIRTNAKTGADLAPQVATNTQRIEDLTTARIPDVIYHGTPKITGGQITNFSTVNYLQFPFEDISRSLPFDIYFSFTTDADVTTQQNIIDSRFGIALAIQNGKGVMALSSNGTSWDIGSSTGTNTLLGNTTYYVKYSWTGTEYNASLSTNDQTYVPDMILSSNKSPYKTTIYIGGCDQDKTGHTPHPFKGIINFSKSKVVVNGITVWEGMADVGIASRANVSLNNLDEVGELRFANKQDKLTQGSAISLEDDVVAVELFNKDKFTVVGTPSISEDGWMIKTGWNGIQQNVNISLSSEIVIQQTFKMLEQTSGSEYFNVFEFTNDSGGGYIRMIKSPTSFGTESRKIGSSTSSYTPFSAVYISANDIVNVKTTFKNGSVIYETSNLTTGQSDTRTRSDLVDNATKLTSINSYIYYAEHGYVAQNLKQFSITVDGQEVFNSTQTIYKALDKKQDVISDLATIRNGASKGSTALQSVPDTYATKTYVTSQGYITSSYHDNTKQDVFDIDLIEGAEQWL